MRFDMKKKALVLLFAVSFILLSGCEVHFGDVRYDVPWYVAFLFAIPFLIIGAVLIVCDMRKNFWAYCPKCKNRFYVKKRVFRWGAAHSPEDSFEFITKCPCCGERTFCRKSYDQD